MTKFLSRLLTFVLIPVVLITAVSVFLPATPRARTSLLFSKIAKDQLLEQVPSPRVLLVGGSNLAYGIDSSQIEEALGLPVIDTAIHVNLGAKYILETTLEEVQEGDIVVVSMEYQQYFGRQMYGGQELQRMVFDVDRSTMKYLDINQWLNILRYFPEYAVSKITPAEYTFERDPILSIYDWMAFNEYGDAHLHWDRDRVGFRPFYPDNINHKFNPKVIDLYLHFTSEVHKRGAEVFFTYPALQATSFHSLEEQIKLVETQLVQSGIPLLGTPERYRLEDKLFYDTPYHLTREGVERRTNLLVADLERAGVGIRELR